MTRQMLALTLSLLLALALLASTAGAAWCDPELVTVIVQFDGRHGMNQQRLIESIGGRVMNSFHLVPAVTAAVPAKAVRALLRNPRVTFVEVDGLASATAEILPWGIDRIDAEVVHDYNKGTGVKVAILDTGIDLNHPDLQVAGNVSFVAGTTSGQDDHGHGTHVAGIVAALDNDIGVIGVAPEASIYAVKVLDNRGNGTWSGIIQGIQWAVDNDMQVINMSLGGTSGSTSLKAACDAAYAAGIVVVASAGNRGNSYGVGDNVLYPARYDSVIAVAATDSSDRRASFSSTGSTVELAAPGVDIYSTLLGGAYGEKSGTSMSSPHVAGVAALVIASGIDDSNGNGRINDDVRLRMQQTAIDFGSAGKDNLYGYGLVNAYGAAPRPSNQPPVANAGPDQTISDSSGSGKAAVTLNGSASYDPDGSIQSWSWSEGTEILGAGTTLTREFAVGAHSVTLKVTDDDGATDTDTVLITVAPNQSPIAHAGSDVVVHDGNADGLETVTLNGSGSYDPDGSIVSWQWKEGAGPLGHTVSLSYDFTVGSHVVTLIVTDNGGATATDTVLVTVDPNQAPVAIAGPDRTVSDPDGDGVETVSLDASASYDPDGAIVAWEWSEGDTVLGTGETLSLSLAVGIHTLTLTVTDNAGLTATDDVVITVLLNQTPVAIAGPDQTVSDADGNGLATVTLDASASYDPDGALVAWEWSEGDTVLGTGETLSLSLAVGIHTLTLKVTDNAGLTATDDVVITVLLNQTPVAIAGPDQTVSDADGNGLATVTLDASASYDPDGALVAWEWSEGDSILGAGETLSLSLAVGIHTLTLKITDNAGLTATDDVVITVLPNQSPVAIAGPDQTVSDTDRDDMATVTLDASASYDPDGAIVAWEWAEGALILGSGQTLNYSFSVGTHTVTLKVTDSGGAASTDDIVITVNEAPQLTMRVASIQMSLVRLYLGMITSAKATVKVVDANGNAVEEVTVVGHWDVATTDSESGVTGSGGLVTFESDKLRFPARGTTFVFVVDSVTRDGWVWDQQGSVTSGQVIVF